jgi:D-sedoheptulose 7-phosphate isomerase
MEASPETYRTRGYLNLVKTAVDALDPQVGPFVEALYAAYCENRTIFIIGNGGSAANASHFAQDLNKGTLADATECARFRAISLTDNISFITALANDEGYDQVFVQQLATLGQPGDLLVAISCSGNSPNVIHAVAYAKAHGLGTIGVTGFPGGRLRGCVDLNVNVHADDVGLVEAVHSVLFHLTVTCLRERIARAAASRTDGLTVR